MFNRLYILYYVNYFSIPKNSKNRGVTSLLKYGRYKWQLTIVHFSDIFK